MVAALKKAQMELLALREKDRRDYTDRLPPYRIVLIEVAPDAPDVPHPLMEAAEQALV